MKKLVAMILICSLAALTACANNGGNSSDINSTVEDGTAEDDMFVDDRCFVSIYDGENSYDIEVDKYGDQFELPEPKGSDNGCDFIGWISNDGMHDAGDLVIAEEFIGYQAMYTSPTSSVLIEFDLKEGGYYTTVSDYNEFEVNNPYTYDYAFSNNDYFIDYYEDANGNRYDFNQKITLEIGSYLILTAVYSENLSDAYKVSINTNAPVDEDFFNETNYRYVKKGQMIPIDPLYEFDGYTFDGWYDAPEGGNFIIGIDETYKPVSDIELYAQWKANL